jgi:hypothetical protein
MKRAGSVLLDTSVIIDYIRGDQRLRPQFAAAATMYVPLVVLGELYFGAQRAPRRDDGEAAGSADSNQGCAFRCRLAPENAGLVIAGRYCIYSIKDRGGSS